MSFLSSIFGSSQPVVDPYIGHVYPSGNSIYNTQITDTTATTATLPFQPGQWVSVGAQATQQAKEVVDPNTQPEMEMSLEDAYGLWVVKFGDKWVKVHEPQNPYDQLPPGQFDWGRVAKRLCRVMLMEHDTGSAYYKLIPKIWK